MLNCFFILFLISSVHNISLNPPKLTKQKTLSAIQINAKNKNSNSFTNVDKNKPVIKPDLRTFINTLIENAEIKEVDPQGEETQMEAEGFKNVFIWINKMIQIR